MRSNCSPPVETVSRVVTVINGHTVAPAAAAPAPSPDDALPTENDGAIPATQRARPARPTQTGPEEEDPVEEESSSLPTRTPVILDSPSTQRIIASISPTLGDADEVSSTSTRTRAKASSSSTANTKTKPSLSPGTSDKSSSDRKDEGGPSTTVWIGVACGVVGALLLVMALSAYYRRWRRRRGSSSDDESFIGKGQNLPPSPRSLARSSMASEKLGYGPDWSDAPLVPPVPAQYLQQAGHEYLLPEPGSDPVPEDTAPWRRDSYVDDTSLIPPAVPRQHARAAPMSIEVAGDSRQFSRPASEVVLNGQADQYVDQSYDYAQQYHPADVRHNSYASSRYEAIEDPRAASKRYEYI